MAFQTFLAGRAASLQKEMNNPLKRMKARTLESTGFWYSTAQTAAYPRKHARTHTLYLRLRPSPAGEKKNIRQEIAAALLCNCHHIVDRGSVTAIVRGVTFIYLFFPFSLLTISEVCNAPFTAF